MLYIRDFKYSSKLAVVPSRALKFINNWFIHGDFVCKEDDVEGLSFKVYDSVSRGILDMNYQGIVDNLVSGNIACTYDSRVAFLATPAVELFLQYLNTSSLIMSTEFVLACIYNSRGTKFYQMMNGGWVSFFYGGAQQTYSLKCSAKTFEKFMVKSLMLNAFEEI